MKPGSSLTSIFKNVCLAAAAGIAGYGSTVGILNFHKKPDNAAVLAGGNSGDVPYDYEPGIPWLKLTGTDRLISCLNHAGAVTSDRWPGVFAKCQDDELLRPVLIRNWAQKDPMGFWNWVRQQKDPVLIRETGEVIFAAWALADPEAAIAASARVGPGTLRKLLVNQIFTTVLNRDAAAGLALLKKTTPRGVMPGLDWIRRDPPEALRLLEDLPHSLPPRAELLSRALEVLSEQDAKAGIAWIETHQRSVTPQQTSSILQEIARRQPEEAVKGAMTLSHTGGGSRCLHAVVQAILEKHPVQAAVELVRQNAGADGLQAVMPALVSKASEQEPALAVELWDQLDSGQQNPQLGTEVANRYARINWPAAAEWTASLDEAALRRQAWPNVARQMPAEETAAMAERVAAMPLDELSDYLLLTIRRALIENLGEAAKDQWIASLPPLHAQWVKALQN